MPVLVVDSESSDRTVAIAQARGARILDRPFRDFVEKRQFALAQVRTPWTLMIDADEELDARLRAALCRADGAPDGYTISRTTFYCGRALRMWSGERLLRLFRTDRVRLEAAPAAGGSAQLHERWICEGAIGQLDGTLLHYSYPTHAAYCEKFERYTAIEAQGLSRSRSRWLRELLMAPVRFAWYALARGAVLDGVAGIRIAWLSATYPAVVRRKALRG